MLQKYLDILNKKCGDSNSIYNALTELLRYPITHEELTETDIIQTVKKAQDTDERCRFVGSQVIKSWLSKMSEGSSLPNSCLLTEEKPRDLNESGCCERSYPRFRKCEVRSKLPQMKDQEYMGMTFTHLKQLTPEELMKFEETHDTDKEVMDQFWENHVNKNFSVHLLEMEPGESYRDFFMRMEKDLEEKFQKNYSKFRKYTDSRMKQRQDMINEIANERVRALEFIGKSRDVKFQNAKKYGNKFLKKLKLKDKVEVKDGKRKKRKKKVEEHFSPKIITEKRKVLNKPRNSKSVLSPKPIKKYAPPKSRCMTPKIITPHFVKPKSSPENPWNY